MPNSECVLLKCIFSFFDDDGFDNKGDSDDNDDGDSGDYDNDDFCDH